MSTVPADISAAPPTAGLKLDEKRGTYGVSLLIVTEGFLFIDLFFSYFYLGNRTHRWLVETPPPLRNALVLLAILLASSFVLELFGKKPLEKGNFGKARMGVAATIILGLIFLGLESYGFAKSWPKLTPATDSYGSIFYTILFFHAAHVTAGLLMLSYAMFLPLGPNKKTPYRPLEPVTLYWHFVDVVWVFVIIFLYIVPNLH